MTSSIGPDLIDLGNSPLMNRRAGLDDTVSSIRPADLIKSYRALVANAPRRADFKDRYFVGHDGSGGTASLVSEKVRAKAIFNSGHPLVLPSARVDIVDYEVPLRGLRSDSRIGDIDLVGVDRALRHLWIFELKVHPNRDTPLKAFLQVLRYSAIVEANWDTISGEVERLFSVELVDQPVLVVAGDAPYWAQIVNTRPAGDWLPALRALADRVAAELDVQIHFVDIGPVDVILTDDGRPHLAQPLAPAMVG